MRHGQETVSENAKMRSGVASESAACSHTDRKTPRSHSPSPPRTRVLVPVPVPNLRFPVPADSSADSRTATGPVDSPVAGRRAGREVAAAGPASCYCPEKGRTRTTMPAAVEVLRQPAGESRIDTPPVAIHMQQQYRVIDCLLKKHQTVQKRNGKC